MNETFVYGPVEDYYLVRYLDRSPDGVTLGLDPLWEPEGVAGRRFLFAHVFSANDLAWLTTTLAGSGIMIDTALPGDWRETL